MKKILLTTASSMILSTTLNAQVAKWDHTAFDSSGHSEYDCINTSNYGYYNVSRSNVAGSDGSSGGANCFGGWSANYDSNFTKRVEYTFSASNLLVSGSLKALSFDIKNYTGGAGSYAIKLFKNNSSLGIASGSISSSWVTKTFSLSNSIAAGDTFKLQLQGYNTGTASNPRLALDNMTFHGEAKCVPEPASTALLALGGFAFILRRRK